MPSTRITCTSCEARFRSPKLPGWIEEPEPRRFETIFHTEFDERTKKARVIEERVEVRTFRGRRPAKYHLCRRCYKKQNGVRRPVEAH